MRCSDRDQLIGRRLRSLAEMLCDGSLTPLLTHLARAEDLTEEDRLALRAIMDEVEADPAVKESAGQGTGGNVASGPSARSIGKWARRKRSLTKICITLRLASHGTASCTPC